MYLVENGADYRTLKFAMEPGIEIDLILPRFAFVGRRASATEAHGKYGAVLGAAAS